MIDSDKFKKQYNQLPPSLQNALLSSNTNESITDAINLSGLKEQSDIYAFIDLVHEVLLQMTKISQFEPELTRRIRLNPSQVKILSKIIDERIFSKYLDVLKAGSVIDNLPTRNTTTHPIDRIIQLRNQTKIAQKLEQTKMPEPQIPIQNPVPESSMPQPATKPMANLATSQNPVTPIAEKPKTETPIQPKSNLYSQIPSRVINLKNENGVLNEGQAKLMNAMQVKGYTPNVIGRMNKMETEPKPIEPEPKKEKPIPPSVKFSASEVITTDAQNFKPIVPVENGTYNARSPFVTNMPESKAKPPIAFPKEPIRYEKPKQEETFGTINENIAASPISRAPNDKVVFDYTKMPMPPTDPSSNKNISENGINRTMPQSPMPNKPEANKDPKIIGNVVDLR